MKLSAPVHILRSRAKALKKESGIPLFEAQNQIAQQEGLQSWSLLMAQQDNLLPANCAELIDYLNPGDLVLVGARPRLGKTLFTASLVAEATKTGHPPSALFTLVDLESEARQRIHNHLHAEGIQSDAVFVDCSDDICADYIVQRLNERSVQGALVVIDHLQLLTEKQGHPSITDQILALKSFAESSGCKILLLSQMDRSVDLTPNQCPTIDQIRLPNPLDTGLFNKIMFLYRQEQASRVSTIALVEPVRHEFAMTIETEPLRLVENA